MISLYGFYHTFVGIALLETKMKKAREFFRLETELVAVRRVLMFNR